MEDFERLAICSTIPSFLSVLCAMLIGSERVLHQSSNVYLFWNITKSADREEMNERGQYRLRKRILTVASMSQVTKLRGILFPLLPPRTIHAC